MYLNTEYLKTNQYLKLRPCSYNKLYERGLYIILYNLYVYFVQQLILANFILKDAGS